MFQNLKIRTLLLLSVMAILASILALPTNVADAINTPWLSVSGRYIKDPQGNNVELRGVSLVDVGVADSRSRNARQLIDTVTNETDGWYARVVRLPVYPEEIDDTPGWNANPDAYFNNHLNPAIQECVARQIYCIIDWHYISDYTSSAINTSTRNFWSYVAPKYANTPNVIFELFNEPMNPDNWSTWRSTAQPWVDLIRSYAPNNLILIGGPRWSQNLSSAASQPFTGSNLVYVAHIYPEHGGQSNWDSWFGNAANSVPFFVTEWGWQQGGNTPTSGTTSGYGVPFSNYLESKGLSWTAWVFDQWWQPVMFDTNYNLLGGESYMGQYTKDLLYQHRNEGLPGVVPPTSVPPTGVPPTGVPPTSVPPTSVPPTSVPPTTGPGTCAVSYVSQNDWGSGATVNVTVKNNSTSAINGWTLTWTFPGNQQISQVWGGSYSQSGASVSVTNASYNRTIGANGGTASFGLNLTYSGTNTAPTNFVLNGVACNGGPNPTSVPPTSVPPTGVPPTSVPPTSVPPTSVPPTSVPPTSVPPTSVPPTSVPPTTGPGVCSVTYAIQNDWGNGATVNVTIRNNGTSAINGWTLTWTFPGNQQITNLWNGSHTQSGASVSVRDATWNATIGANGGTVSFGFNLTYSGTNAKPTDFRLNGVTCQIQ